MLSHAFLEPVRLSLSIKSVIYSAASSASYSAMSFSCNKSANITMAFLSSVRYCLVDNSVCSLSSDLVNA